MKFIGRSSDELILASVPKRNELMIIYLEDLGAMKLTAADLAQGGKAAGQWEAISKDLLERATKNMKLSR